MFQRLPPWMVELGMLPSAKATNNDGRGFENLLDLHPEVLLLS